MESVQHSGASERETSHRTNHALSLLQRVCRRLHPNNISWSHRVFCDVTVTALLATSARPAHCFSTLGSHSRQEECR